MEKTQNVSAIVRKVARHRARERQIPLHRRQINVYPGLKGDYWVNRHEIKIKLSYAVSGNPFEMMDAVLNAVVEFDSVAERQKAMGITRIKSEIMKWSAYLERTLTREMYDEFVLTLHSNNKDHDQPV